MSKTTDKRQLFEDEHNPVDKRLVLDSDDVDRKPRKKARWGQDSCENWSVDDVVQKLETRGLADVAPKFKEEEICGKVLAGVTEKSLEDMGIRTFGKRKLILDFVAEVKPRMPVTPIKESKIFNDPIHGHIELHPLCIKIIDTPQFQRLRYIKQLGGCYYVFPGCSHNRFEHCIGVCYLAGQLTRELQRRQPELDITDEDVLCVEIAGLCHDLGHGPFSHLFDQCFIPLARPESSWKHENASVDMFDYMVSDNDLKKVFQEHGLYERDRKFITEQIAGPVTERNSGEDWPYQGRSKVQSFLYEIVANKRNGIDVDKWDYFARDCHHLGIKNNFDHNRFIKFARVLIVDGDLQICSKDKEAGTLYDMFHTRQTLHRRAYQHPVSKIVETMITEALLKADDHIKIPGKDGVPRRMSEAIDDMVAYCKLTDFVMYQILLSEDPSLAESKKILSNIHRRQLYKCMGQSSPKSGKFISKVHIPEIQHEVASAVSPLEADGVVLRKEDLIIHIINLDYSMKESNPIDKVRFYSKTKPNEAVRVRKDQVSQMLPEKFAEQLVRVYCKSRDDKVQKLVKESFQVWCESHHMNTAKTGNAPAEMTPLLPSSQGNSCSEYSHGSQETTPDPKASAHRSKLAPEYSAGKFRSHLSFGDK